MDAESNDNTPAIALPLFHEDIYRYACVLMYNMHILGKITFQVSTQLFIFSFGRHAHTYSWMQKTIKLLPRFNSMFLMKILMFTTHISPENTRKYTS